MSTFEGGVDQLIERVKQDGLEKANKERDAILQKAQKEAEAIIEAAKANAQKLLLDAKRHQEQERFALEKELELAARDFSLKLSEYLRNQMMFPVIKESVRLTLKEPQFLADVLKRLVVEYVKDSQSSIDVLVPKEMRTSLAAFFAGAAFDALEQNDNLRLKDENGLEGFVLIKRGENYVWDFRVETVALELMRLVEPQLKKYFMTSKKVNANQAEAALV